MYYCVLLYMQCVHTVMGQTLTYEPADRERSPNYTWPRYKYSKTLGKGAFGVVVLVHDTEQRGRVYALKKIQCRSDDDLSNATRELETLSKLSHPNIMALYDTRCIKTGECSEIYMIFEFCPGGTLADRLEKPSTKAQDIKWMRQLANAVAYIHALALVHRDLKPDNVLLSSSDNIKIGDFGMAREFVGKKQENETWANYYMSKRCGTLFYMAPEVFEGHYTEKGDVFALGILLYAIVEREYHEVDGKKYYGIFILFPGGDRAPLGPLMYVAKEGLTVTFTKCNPKLAQIIGSTLVFDQKSRADAATIRDKLNDYIES